MKKLFILCVCAGLAYTLSAQMTLSKGEMVAGVTYNSAYTNETITDDLAFTVGYAVSDEFTIMATRDENTDGEDASINLGVRYFYNGFYGQLNMIDVQDATADDEDATMSVGKMFALDWVDGLYLDPSITISGLGSDNDTDTSFGMTLGMRF